MCLSFEGRESGSRKLSFDLAVASMICMLCQGGMGWLISANLARDCTCARWKSVKSLNELIKPIQRTGRREVLVKISCH